MGSYADWNVLTVWTLGWGADRSAAWSSLSVVPAPDAIWGGVLTVWAVGAGLAARGVAARAGGGDEAAARRAIMPALVPLLAATGVAGAVLAAAGVAVSLLEAYPFGATMQVLAVGEVVRAGAMEVLTHTPAALLLQSVVSHGALRRAAGLAATWAAAFAVLSAALLAAYWRAMNDDGDDDAMEAATAVPRYTVAGINFAIVAVYAGGILFLNLGRPALRPYAWFVVLWRALTAVGLLLSTHADAVPTSAARAFDIAFLVLVVVGYPATLYAALVADTAYWRGMCRGLPGASFSWRTALLAGMCGCGDIGAGLGLRGWGDAQRAAVRASARTGALGVLAAPVEAPPASSSGGATAPLLSLPPADVPTNTPAAPTSCCAAAVRAAVSCCQGRSRARRWSFASGLGEVLAAERPPPREAAMRLLAASDRPPSWSGVQRWSARADVLHDPPLAGLLALLDTHRDQLLDFTRLRLTHVLAETPRAVVFQGFYHRRAVAVKVLRAPHADATAVFGAAHAEMAAVRMLHHPALVACQGLCCCPPDVAIVFDLCTGGTLRTALASAVTSDIPLLAAALTANGAIPRPAAAALYTRGYVYIPVRYVRASLLTHAGAASAELASVFAAAARGWLRLVPVDDAVVDALPDDTRADTAAGGGDGDGDGDDDALGVLFDSVRRGAAAAMVEDAAVSTTPAGSPARARVSSMMRRSVLHARLASQDSVGRINAALAAGSGGPIDEVDEATLAEASVPSDLSTRGGSAALRHSQVVASGASGSSAHASQRQLMADMAVLGGLAVDVLDFPYANADVWPVDDVEEFAFCWQFDPGAGTAMAHVGPLPDAPAEAPPTAAATAAAAALAAAGRRHRQVGTVAVLQPLMSTSTWAAAMSAAAGDGDAAGAGSGGEPDSAAPPQLSWIHRLRVAAQVAEVVAYMHGNAPPVVHTGLTSATVLLAGDGGAKVGGLGGVQRAVGAPAHSMEGDVYALCTLMWELLTGGVPYDVLQPGAVTTATDSGARLPIPARCPRAYAHLLRCGWHGEPAMRPPASLYAAVLRRLADVAGLAGQLSDIDLTDDTGTAAALDAARHASLRRNEAAGTSPEVAALVAPVYRRDTAAFPLRAGGIAGAPTATGAPAASRDSLRSARDAAASGFSAGSSFYRALALADAPPHAPPSYGAAGVELSRAPVASLGMRDVALE